MLGLRRLLMAIDSCLPKTRRRIYGFCIIMFIIWLSLTVIQVLKII